MMNQTYTNESILIGLTIRYPEACRILLPDLTPDKFVHNFLGEFGSEHGEIWSTICDLFLVEHILPSLVNVLSKVSEPYQVYIKSLVSRLEDQYKIFEYDSGLVLRLGREIDKQGVMYNVARHSRPVGLVIANVEAFNHAVQSVEEVEGWVNSYWHGLQDHVQLGTTGYAHISEAVSNVKDQWKRQYEGEQLEILNCGMPTLVSNQLFPLRNIAVIHGLSNSGKSAFVHLVNLGTAIGLKANNIPGCVAINSLEMSQEGIVKRYAAALAQVDWTRLRGGKKPLTLEEFNKLMEWLDFVEELPIFVDDTNMLTTSALQYRTSGLHVSPHGPIMQLSSDYNELFGDEGNSEELRVHKIFQNQFNVSRQLGCSVIVISQSSTDNNNSTYIAGAMGTRYSRGILQNADIVAEVYNPVEAEKMGIRVRVPEAYQGSNAWLLVQKYREGSKFEIPLGWVPENTMFYDLKLNGHVKNYVLFDHLQQAQDMIGSNHRVVSPTETGVF